MSITTATVERGSLNEQNCQVWLRNIVNNEKCGFANLAYLYYARKASADEPEMSEKW